MIEAAPRVVVPGFSRLEARQPRHLHAFAFRNYPHPCLRHHKVEWTMPQAGMGMNDPRLYNRPEDLYGNRVLT